MSHSQYCSPRAESALSAFLSFCCTSSSQKQSPIKTKPVGQKRYPYSSTFETPPLCLPVCSSIPQASVFLLPLLSIIHDPSSAVFLHFVLSSPPTVFSNPLPTHLLPSHHQPTNASAPNSESYSTSCPSTPGPPHCSSDSQSARRPC